MTVDPRWDGDTDPWVDHDLAEQRESDYGNARVAMERTAHMWTAILGVPVKAEQVAFCMVALKAGREMNRHKSDNVEDAVGYVRIAFDLIDANRTEQVHARTL